MFGKILNAVRKEPIIVSNTLAVIGAWAAAAGHPEFQAQEAGIATIVITLVSLWGRSKVSPNSKE